MTAENQPEPPAETDQKPEPSETDQPKPKARVVARRDVLGRPVEEVEVEDPVAAIHWDEKWWKPVSR